jgi:type II secretory pathway pseudopilin PulG
MRTEYKKPAFTIVELLTVMSIIIILISMLVPSLNAIRRFAKKVTQKSQFHDISKGLEVFSIDFDGYPDSSEDDLGGASYCGAMKLCEALVGQDDLGFHPDSIFDDEGKDKNGNDLYFNRRATPPDPTNASDRENLRARKALYIEGKDIQTSAIEDLFPTQSAFDPCCPVLCDVFKRNELRGSEGRKLGMPILYYKADTSKLTHDANDGVTNGTNIYNYLDNDELLAIKPPWAGGDDHPLYDSSGKGAKFYSITTNPEASIERGNKIYAQPYNKVSYILISAGWDGMYGTTDDVYNFRD